MKKNSKRFQNLKNLILKKTYSYQEAITVLKKLQAAKFIESLEAHINLNINPKYQNQQLRSNLILPHGTGKTLKIAVLTESENIQSTLDMGANIAGSETLINDILKGNLNFDLLLTTPHLMPQLVKLGKILGPKGLMPSPKSGTVTSNILETITEFKKGKLEYRADNTGIVHINFGKINFSEVQIQENLITIYNSIEKNKPVGIKGRYFKTFHICSTMSPSLKIDLFSFKN
jgi:large subunit ribosomal protein L1